MLRSILVALDGSPSSLTASRFSLELARRVQARVEGVGIVNSAWIQRPEAVPLGATEYKASLGLRELEDANARVAAAMQAFTAMCNDAGVTSVASRSAGEPIKVIELAAASHDLVVVGSRSIFDVTGEMCELPLCVDRLIRSDPRPIMLVPYDLQLSNRSSSLPPILVAFDGSPASSRAVHMFALLGLASGRVIHVLTQDDDSKQNATNTASRACALLSLHAAAETHAIGLGDAEAGRPAETILGIAAALQPELIVMGAYGRRGIQEIFGSCTREVLNACPTPIFLYH